MQDMFVCHQPELKFSLCQVTLPQVPIDLYMAGNNDIAGTEVFPLLGQVDKLAKSGAN